MLVELTKVISMEHLPEQIVKCQRYNKDNKVFIIDTIQMNYEESVISIKFENGQWDVWILDSEDKWQLIEFRSKSK